MSLRENLLWVVEALISHWLVTLIGLVVMAGAFALGAFIFGRDYKDRIKRLEQQRGSVVSQVTNIYQGPAHQPLGDIKEIKVMSQSEYDALPIKDDKTLYIIVETK